MTLLVLVHGACDDNAQSGDTGSATATGSAVTSTAASITSPTALAAGSVTAPATTSATAASAAVSAAALPSDPGMVGADSQDALLALLPSYSPEAEPFLRKHVGPGTGGKSNQGNPRLARHAISQQRCLAGLSNITLQTPAQRKQCGGHQNMVPIYPKGDASLTRVCIDIFEYPNKACELPFVWTGATMAHQICKRAGKRLCKQPEWALACEGDPAGGEPRRYAYGDTLDLGICNTNKSAIRNHLSKQNQFPKHSATAAPASSAAPAHSASSDESVICDPDSVKSTWETCSTNTEPAGAFPRCRSRFGVFDLHGNVAEAMTRYDFEENERVSQLKGSAFFYVDVHRKFGAKRSKETYPDHCRYDPRWHVQSMRKAWHVNYHLGFRCCVDAKPTKADDAAAKKAAADEVAEGSKEK